MPSAARSASLPLMVARKVIFRSNYQIDGPVGTVIQLIHQAPYGGLSQGTHNVPEPLKTLGVDPPEFRADELVVAYLFGLGPLPIADVMSVGIVF